MDFDEFWRRAFEEDDMKIAIRDLAKQTWDLNQSLIAQGFDKDSALYLTAQLIVAILCQE